VFEKTFSVTDHDELAMTACTGPSFEKLRVPAIKQHFERESS
jgi:hypothetical protein